MAITYSIDGGADAAKFNINATSGALTFKVAPDFEAPGDANTDNIYEVSVKATDAGGLASSKLVKVTVTDVSEGAPPQITSAGAVTVKENATAVMTITATDPDDTTEPPIEPPVSSGDWPDSTNTGVRPGSALTVISNGLTLNAAGTVVQDKDIRGIVRIDANNCKLINCKISGAVAYLVKINQSVTGTVIENCTIDGMGTGTGSNGIQGTGTVTKCNIYNIENSFAVDGGGPVLIQDCCIHHLKAAGSPHYDGIQIQFGKNITIKHNVVINDYDQTSAVFIQNLYGNIDNVLVEDNVLVGGGYTVYSDASKSSTNKITNLRFLNNHMGPGKWGVSAFTGNTPTYTGNVNDGREIVATLTINAP